MSGAVGRGDASDAQKGRVDATKVKRYRPGQAPEWMKSHEDDFELPSAAAKTAPPAQQAGTSQRIHNITNTRNPFLISLSQPFKQQQPPLRSVPFALSHFLSYDTSLLTLMYTPSISTQVA